MNAPLADSDGRTERAAACVRWSLRLALLLALIVTADRIGDWLAAGIDLYRLSGSETFPRGTLMLVDRLRRHDGPAVLPRH